MDNVTESLTVFFDDPFWVGVFEFSKDGKLSVCKVTFGAEPKDFEIYEYILKNYCSLKFSPAVDAVIREKPKNPKRMQRDVKRSLLNKGVGTKSMQALKLQQEQNKLERKVKTREQKQTESERLFELKQQKKKDRHRGH